MSFMLVLALWASSVEGTLAFGAPNEVRARADFQQTAPDDWLQEAKAAMEVQDWKEAIRILSPILESEPEQMQARLLRAICYREEARSFFYSKPQILPPLMPSGLQKRRREARAEALGESESKKRAFDAIRALVDFEFVLSRDSLYEDVLIQYAKLWRDHKVLEQAIELGEDQIRLKPDLAEAHVELVNTYRNYVVWTSADKAEQWLNERRSPYAAYAIGEVYRQSSKADRADRQFEQLLAGSLSVPPQPMLLSRARIYMSREQVATAYDFIEAAMRVETLTEARLLFEDFKYVLSEEEYEQYLTLNSVEVFLNFFTRMWDRRDPMPAASRNERLLEHYRRLVLAEKDYAHWGVRTWFNNPDQFKQLDFPGAMSLNREFNDRGLVYIRQGEPDERVITVTGPIESWRYLSEGMEFHFGFAEGGTGSNWRLIPFLTDCRALDDRKHWGKYYIKMAPRVSPDGPCASPANTFDVIQGEREMADDSRRMVMQGLTTDRHTWVETMEPFEFPYVAAAFRGGEGRTDLDIYYAVPIGQLSEGMLGDSLTVEVGIALHDTTWRSEVNEASLLHLATTQDVTTAFHERMQLSVPPDSYHVALHSMLPDSPKLGGYQFEKRIPDFSEPRLLMSDVLLAYSVEETELEPTSRFDLKLEVNAFQRFTVDEPVHVYFEVYHLTLNPDDRAQYTVEYRMMPQKKGGLKLFRRKARPSLSLRTNFESDTPSPIVYTEIDMSKVDTGTYDLVIEVSDTQTGETVSQTVQVELERP